jgi:hypothetical protein
MCPVAFAVFNRVKADSAVSQLAAAEGELELNFGYAHSFKEKLKGIKYTETNKTLTELDTVSTWQHVYFHKIPNVGVFYNADKGTLTEGKHFLLEFKKRMRRMMHATQ